MDTKIKQIEPPDIVLLGRRRMWRLFYLWLMFVLGTNVLRHIVEPKPNILFLWIQLISSVVPAILIVRFILLERRHKKVAIKADYTLCLHCEYDLTGLNQQHKCPECGMEYDLDEVRKCWMRYRPLWPWSIAQK